MTVRLDRCAEHEARSIASRMRAAAAEYDDARLAGVEEAFDRLAQVPATSVRRLKSSPEGLERLIRAFEGLRGELVHPYGVRWNWRQCEQYHHLMGGRRGDVPLSRARGLTDAVDGNFEHLDPCDGEGLAKVDRQLWAVGQLVAIVEGQVAELRALLSKFDRSAIELDRAEAPSRALFDDSKGSILARKYEAATERGLFRSIREFREAQAEAAAAAEIVADQPVEAGPAEEPGSCLPACPGDDERGAGRPVEVAPVGSRRTRRAADARKRASFPGKRT